MKKYFLIVLACVLAYVTYDYLVFHKGDIYIPHVGEISYLSKVEDEKLWLIKDGISEVFELRGVNLGLGKPGHYATERTITKEEYLRWFKQIQDMGANTIRVYTLAHDDFYDAFYEYNKDNPDPLYLIHGVWVDDYLLNSYRSAFDEQFTTAFLEDCKDVVDTVHGRLKTGGPVAGGQVYDKDISMWTYGYILGVEWDERLVGYTDRTEKQRDDYQGTYFSTKNASNFEIFLAEIGDQVVAYETSKYGSQRVIAFSNWATTDPFHYTEGIERYFRKYANIDVEHIVPTENFVPGQFASYHVYPYFPDYYSYYQVHEENTYLQYLTRLNEHHTMPVVISEFGVPSSRGMAAVEKGMGRNQGNMSEQEQGAAIVSMYEDIKEAGSAGGIVFTWQDEWFKRTWNTMAHVDLHSTAYWSDYQTNEQYFGLLAFDPGEEESVAYVDGNRSEWKQEDVLGEEDGYRISAKYDEKFLYFLVEKDGYHLGDAPLYLPIDVTPKSGSEIIGNFSIETDRPADFVIVLDGEDESRILVQERYNTTYALYSQLLEHDKLPFSEVPALDSQFFEEIELLLVEEDFYIDKTKISFSQFDMTSSYHVTLSQTYETGKLTYGNSNPSSASFNSLADFCSGPGFVEIKLPWELLNFADPSTMRIHDDYYMHYGVEYITIDEIYIGAGSGAEIIEMQKMQLKPLGKEPEYHERLKESYYILKDYWSKEGE